MPHWIVVVFAFGLAAYVGYHGLFRTKGAGRVVPLALAVVSLSGGIFGTALLTTSWGW